MPAIRRRAMVASAVFAPALAVLALLAYGFGREARYIESPLLGRPAPPFALTLFDGRTLRLEDLRGQGFSGPLRYHLFERARPRRPHRH